MKSRFEEFSRTLQPFAAATAAPGQPATPPQPSVASVTGRLRTLFAQVDGVDLAPTTQQKTVAEQVVTEAAALQVLWDTFRTTTLPAFNQELQGKGLPVIATPK
jgi:hypothetical protein